MSSATAEIDASDQRAYVRAIGLSSPTALRGFLLTERVRGTIDLDRRAGTRFVIRFERGEHA